MQIAKMLSCVMTLYRYKQKVFTRIEEYFPNQFHHVSQYLIFIEKKIPIIFLLGNYKDCFHNESVLRFHYLLSNFCRKFQQLGCGWQASWQVDAKLFFLIFIYSRIQDFIGGYISRFFCLLLQRILYCYENFIF